MSIALYNDDATPATPITRREQNEIARKLPVWRRDFASLEWPQLEAMYVDAIGIEDAPDPADYVARARWETFVEVFDARYQARENYHARLHRLAERDARNANTAAAMAAPEPVKHCDGCQCERHES